MNQLYKKKYRRIFDIAVLFIFLFQYRAAVAQDTRWPIDKVESWYRQQSRIVGVNYVASDAVNQLEMWQPQTFDLKIIDKELSLASRSGINTVRVFLHDQLWGADNTLIDEMDQFLNVAASHNIKTVFVLFDSCWDPNPKRGTQHAPISGVHNSGWVQSPGRDALESPTGYDRLEAYVKGVIGHFSNDSRILAWDLWNEPDNDNRAFPSYHMLEPTNKFKLVAHLLPNVFKWARLQNPIQPLTSGLWHDVNWDKLDKLNAIEIIQIESSDFLTFHDYNWPEYFRSKIQELSIYGRPIICTEFMARSVGSTFDADLPIARLMNVGVISWGLVAGKTQTYLPWESWQHPYVTNPPPVWFHDLFNADGTPYRPSEIDALRSFGSNR